MRSSLRLLTYILLAPLIDANPDCIELNYNTERKLRDDENVMDSNCLSSDIVGSARNRPYSGQFRIHWE